MKKWAKVLVIIGIIWIVATLIFGSILYFKIKQFSGRGFLNESDITAMGNWKGLIETVDARSPFTTIFFYFLEFGIPAWVLFIIVGIWGREKKIKLNNIYN